MLALKVQNQNKKNKEITKLKLFFHFIKRFVQLLPKCKEVVRTLKPTKPSLKYKFLFLLFGETKRTNKMVL